MKRRIIISLLIVIATVCLFAISVNATAIDKDTTVTLNGSFTVGDATVTNPTVELYDEDGYALVWYLNTENKLVSDRAVNLITVTDNKAKFSDVSKFYGGTQQKGVIVVNLRDDFVSDGLSGIEKFDSNFQFGYYGANRNVPIQYFYFPKTATEIIDRMFQSTQLMIADIEPGTPITRMGVHAVTQSNLKEFFVPKGIPNFIEQDDTGVFQDTQLEKIVFEEGSQITVIPYKCFYMCSKLKELVLPNSVEEIHYRALQFSMFGTDGKLEKLVLGANFKGFKGTTADNYYVRGTKNLNVYLPATFTADNVDVSSAHQYFTLCSNVTFYYCGTEAEWDRLIAKISEGKNGTVGNDSGENIVTAKANGKVVFNYNACDAFYNGVHTPDAEKSNACVELCANCGKTTIEHDVNAEMSIVLAYGDFSKVGTKTTKCLNEGCSLNTAPAVEEVKELFTCRGYSVPENGDGGITLGYVINYDAIEYYEQLTGKAVSFGVFAVLKDRLGSNDIFDAEGKAADGVISANLSNSKFSVFQLKVVGFKDEQKDVKLAMGAYVAVSKDNDTTYSYMQYGDVAESEKYAFASYNDVLQIVSENNKAE